MKSIISIITPLYNKETYIEETIKSVISQTFDHWEMIIVDNGSSDNSLLIAKEYVSEKIHVLECLKRGPGAARNFGLRYAQGDWILFLDADDLLRPKYLESQLNAVSDNPDAEIIASCWAEFVEDASNLISFKEPAGFNTHSSHIEDTAIAFTPWAPHAVITQRKILSEEYLWPEELDQYLGEDTAFWFRLVYDFKVAYNYNSQLEALYRANTPNCRTNFEPKKWFNGLHHAVLKNLEFLNERGTFPTFTQCEALTRLYSGIYQLAHTRKDSEIMDVALNEARCWLKSYFDKNARPKLSMIIRRLIGLKLFLQFI